VGQAPLFLGALDAKGSQHVHNVTAARQRLDPEKANDVECSAPRTGDGDPSSRGARGDDRRVHRWGLLPAPTELRPVPKPVRYMPRWYADVSSCNARADLADNTHAPMSRRRMSGPRWRHQAGSGLLVAARHALCEVVLPQLSCLVLEVELPLCQVPCVLATFERIRQSHPFPAPMQLGDAPSGRYIFGAGRACRSWREGNQNRTHT
jgi:hypothetical protein